MTGQQCDAGWFYIDGEFKGPRLFAMCADETGEVVSFFSASYISPVPVAPDGYFGMEVPEGIEVNIGWTWDGTQFNPPVG
jgi:hypothetical protein